MISKETNRHENPIQKKNVASTSNLKSIDCYNKILTNYGQSAENTITLPDCENGMNFLFQVETSGAGNVHLKATSSDKIYFDGIALDDGDKVSCTTPAVGNFINFWTIQTGESSYDWIAESGRGTWVDGGA